MWEGEGLVFTGGGDGTPSMTVDGDSIRGPSPMDTLLLALCGCMASDVCVILEKSRVPFTGLEVLAEGARMESEPRRYHTIRLTYLVAGVSPEHDAKLERAISLSKEKYCSVLHTLITDTLTQHRRSHSR